MTRAPQPPALRDRWLLAMLRAVPVSLARHVMFLLNTRPALADAWGYHVRPIHYYEPLPDFRLIDGGAATRRRLSASIDFDVDAQRQRLRRLAASYRPEIESLATTRAFDFLNEYFAGFDAAMYYAIIRDVRPARIIEIGAGMSTRIAELAGQRNRADGERAEIICIEPFPQARLTEHMPAVTLIKQPVEQVALETFDALEANDILFIDSSHAAKFGGDVCREFLDILPRLKPGVWIHVHDIFLPDDYPVAWLTERRLAFNEQYLLEAFLSFNRTFAVRAANHWLALEHRGDAEALAPASIWPGTDVGCASFWMQRVA